MFNIFYSTLFILSFLMFIALVTFFQERISIYYVLLFASILVVNFGYMQLCTSENVGMAIYANQTVYLGACFCPFFLLMCMADLCKIKIPSAFPIGMVLFASIVFFFTSTIGESTLYYKSVSLIRENGNSILVKEYGPLHILYPVYLIAIMVVCLVFIILSFRKKKDVSYVTSVLLLICTAITVGVYIFEKVIHLEVELIPVAYVISQMGVLFLLRRISLYDISAITADSMVESISFGFVICDSKEKFLGGDVAAKMWFPEITELNIDVPIKEENTDFLMQVGKWVRGEEEREVVHFEREGRIIEAKHAIINQKKHHPVHCLYLRDDTEQQAYTKLVEQYNENLERDVNANKELTPQIAKCIIKAAPLHDFGKIAIPDVILNKPGKFEPEEYEEMKTHAAKGAVIVERILQNTEDTTFKRIAVNLAHYHHEKWDGSGYPEGISKNNIPFEARVMALADVFDALVSKRVYKDSYGYDKAFSIITENCGTHFDPQLCKEFLKCRASFEKLYDSYTD